MACGTIVGEALEFGVSDDEASLTTQSVQVTRKMDKKEARDKCGIVVAVAYYNSTAEITIEGLGLSAQAVAAALTLTGTLGQLASGLIYADEVQISKANEEFVKSSIRATQYSGITA